MAYLDTGPMLAASPAPLHTPIADAIDAGFDRSEWEVILLARQDGLASLSEPSRLMRALVRLSGGPVKSPLANPRLEALRRFAVLAWHYGYALPVSAIKAFKEAGFSLDHAELLLASVAVGRTQHGRGMYA